MDFDPLGKTNALAFAGAVRDAFKRTVAILPEETRTTIAALEYRSRPGPPRADMSRTTGEYALACPLGVPIVLGGSFFVPTPGSGESAIHHWVKVRQITNDQAETIDTDEGIEALSVFIYNWDKGLIPQEDLAELFSVSG